MKGFEKKSKNAYTIIVGCGRLGSNLANTLSNEGENVLILDEDKNAFRRLAPNFGGLSVVAGGTDLEILRQSNIQKASCVIAVTNEDNVNIMVAQMAKELFGVPRVIARLQDPECESVYKRLGIQTICPAVLSAIEIDKCFDTPSAKEEAI